MSTFGVITVGALLAATAAAKPGIGPDWLMPGGRPIKLVLISAPAIGVADEAVLSPRGISRAFVITLLLPPFPADFEDVTVPALSIDAPLDSTTAGLDVKCAVDTEGLGDAECVDVDVDVNDVARRSATDLTDVGARLHLPVTHPPTLPIRPRPPCP